MRTILLLFILTADTWSATVTVCASGCTTTSLQTALDTTANCGDTISIKSTEPQTAPAGGYNLSNRGCALGTPITVTTDRAAWLPAAGTRITPSHLGNLAIIRTSDTAPAISGSLSAGVPPKNWRFVGIGFTTTYLGSFTYNLVFPKNYIAANASEVPDDFTFDRCYFYSPLPNGGSSGVDVNQAVYGAISNLTVKESFFGDIANPGFETHDIFLISTPGPATIRNNFMVTAGIPIFAGGSIADYPVAPANIDVRYNYTWRPWKWNSDPAQPFYADFLANGSYAPCLKNHGEFKYANTVTWRYNGHENMWQASQCQGQFPGFAMTVRTNWDASVEGNSGINYIAINMGSVTMTDTTHLTWGTAYNIPTVAVIGYVSSLDYGVCVNLPGIGLECHPFTVFDNAAKTITTTVPFSSAPAGGHEWFVTVNGSMGLNAVTVENNVYKNVSRGINNVGTSAANGVGDAGILKNPIVRNNLFWNNNSYMTGASFWVGYAAEESYSFDPSGYTIGNNTFYSTVAFDRYVALSRVVRGTNTRQPKWNLWSMQNNLVGPSATYPLLGDDVGTSVSTIFRDYFSNSNFKNNGFPGVDTGTCTLTAGNTCSGNISTLWSDPFASSTQGILKVRPGMIYSKADTSQNDTGVNFDQLPLITSVKLNPASKTALLEFDLSGPIADAGNTQPCVLEVSSSRNLHSDLNTYTVINDLNPTFFQQPDTSARVNAKLLPILIANRHVSWPIGQEATVLGDDDQTHDLRLLESTVYYGRLMCYGDTKMFTFATAPIPSSSVRYPLTANLKIGAPLGTTTVRVSYGPSSALGTSADFPAGTTVSLPLASGALTYYKLQYLSGGQITFTSPVSSLLGGQ